VRARLSSWPRTAAAFPSLGRNSCSRPLCPSAPLLLRLVRQRKGPVAPDVRAGGRFSPPPPRGLRRVALHMGLGPRSTNYIGQKAARAVPAHFLLTTGFYVTSVGSRTGGPGGRRPGGGAPNAIRSTFFAGGGGRGSVLSRTALAMSFFARGERTVRLRRAALGSRSSALRRPIDVARCGGASGRDSSERERGPRNSRWTGRARGPRAPRAAAGARGRRCSTSPSATARRPRWKRTAYEFVWNHREDGDLVLRHGRRRSGSNYLNPARTELRHTVRRSPGSGPLPWRTNLHAGADQHAAHVVPREPGAAPRLVPGGCGRDAALPGRGMPPRRELIRSTFESRDLSVFVVLCAAEPVESRNGGGCRFPYNSG